MPHDGTYNGSGAGLVANILPAGTSAVLLTFAYVHTELWFVSFFALVPFVWRQCHATRKEAVVLGMILATTYLIATSTGGLARAPTTFLLRLFSLNVAFAVSGLAINLAARSPRPAPLFMALLWTPIQYALIRCSGLDTVFLLPYSSCGLPPELSTLLGAIAAAFAIAFLNSVAFILVLYVQRKAGTGACASRAGLRLCPSFKEATYESRWHSHPECRAPPGLASQ